MKQQAVPTDIFFEFSAKIVQGFIQSVVAVDDQMSFDKRPVIEVDDLVEPDEDESFASAATAEPELAKSVDGNDHKLYYQDLSAAFAKKGIVCSGFQPLDEVNETISTINSSSRNADITILDWQMDAGNTMGALATDSILKIIESDLKEGGRLRLIMIYTAENVADVITKLFSSLTPHSPFNNVDNITFERRELGFCKVGVVGKDNDGEELTDYVINSFTELTAGLLSNAALSAVSDIRDKTHNILYRFNKGLDPAYLSHVLGLLSSPDMRDQAHQVALDYAIDLISDEIKSELQISAKVKDSLAKNKLSVWPEHVNKSGSKKLFGLTVGEQEEVKFCSSRMTSFLTITSSEELKAALDMAPRIAFSDDLSSEKVFEKNIIQLSVNTLLQSQTQHLEFSAIECSRRDVNTNSDRLPILKQGVILKVPSRNQYFVCIQPLCDSVRLKNDTGFIFLKISKAKSNNPFSHVIRGRNDTHIKLNISPSSKKLTVINFSPCTTMRVVKSCKKENKFFFKSVDGEDLEWCGELKQAVSQSISNSLAAHMSRVGLDSFEWLRLKSQ